jgi:hypothetical protein
MENDSKEDWRHEETPRSIETRIELTAKTKKELQKHDGLQGPRSVATGIPSVTTGIPSSEAGGVLRYGKDYGKDYGVSRVENGMTRVESGIGTVESGIGSEESG